MWFYLFVAVLFIPIFFGIFGTKEYDYHDDEDDEFDDFIDCMFLCDMFDDHDD